GNNQSRVFQIASNTIVSISGLKMADGRSTNGGAIYNAGSLAILECWFAANTAAGISATYTYGIPPGDGSGGGIYNAGSLAVRNNLFQGNNAYGGGGGSGYSTSTGGSGSGGAIFNAGVLSVSGSTFFSNLARGGDGGPGQNAS